MFKYAFSVAILLCTINNALDNVIYYTLVNVFGTELRSANLKLFVKGMLLLAVFFIASLTLLKIKVKPNIPNNATNIIFFYAPSALLFYYYIGINIVAFVLPKFASWTNFPYLYNWMQIMSGFLVIGICVVSCKIVPDTATNKASNQTP
jgi:hypothetical protein